MINKLNYIITKMNNLQNLLKNNSNTNKIHKI